MREIAPITIGPRNAVEMTGLTWRWLRDHAAELGVPVWRIAGKSMIPAAPLLAALERAARADAPEQHDDESEREAMRAALGMTRRTG